MLPAEHHVDGQADEGLGHRSQLPGGRRLSPFQGSACFWARAPRAIARGYGRSGKKRCQVPLRGFGQRPWPPRSAKCRFQTETSDRFRDPRLVAKGHASGNRSLHFLLLFVGERSRDEINPMGAPAYRPRQPERLLRRRCVRPPPQTAKPPFVWRIAQTRRVSSPLHTPADSEKVILILDGDGLESALIPHEITTITCPGNQNRT